MKLSWILAALMALAMFVASPAEGKRVFLRPMTAREVYRVLREAGREDAVPEGRVVTQGLAAMKGFALGLTKGIGGSLLYDLATSNATTEFISSINVTGLMSGFTLPEFTLPEFTLPTINISSLFGSTSSSSSGSKITYTTQEICFSSRAANEISEEDDDEDTAQGRQATTTGDTVTSVATTPDTTNAGSVTTDNGTTDTGTTDAGTGTDTDTTTTTSTGTGDSVNCIVIKKPTLSSSRRRRRAARRARRH